MAPLRRYLRITQFSVLEVRIYLHKPSDIAWLLSNRDNVLQRIITAVKPHVLPKLREENENAKTRKGGKKKKGVKDVAESEDFEVSIFLKEASTRHSLLTKRKNFQDKPRIKSTGSRLTGWLNNKENPIHIEEETGPVVLQEDGDEETVELRDVPEAGVIPAKRKTRTQGPDNQEDEALFVSSSDEEFFQTQRPKTSKRRKRQTGIAEEEEENGDQNGVGDEDDKKKMALNTAYDGFSIYGRTLCLIVKRKGGSKKDTTSIDGQPAGGSQMMEQWVSTQANGDAWQDDEIQDG